MKLVTLPFHDWRKFQAEGFRTRDAHILQEFDRDPWIESVLVIDRPVSRAERLLRRTGAFVGGRVVGTTMLGGRTARLTAVGERTTVLDIADPTLIGPVTKRRGWWFDVFAEPATIDCIRWAIESCDAGGAPWIAWHPAIVGAVQALNPARFVFDSLDNWLIHPVLSEEANRATAAYAELLPRAQATFVSGPASARALAEWAPDAHILANGVDPSLFVGPFERPGDFPPSPVVGYVGKLARRIDDELVAETAARLPEVSFTFLGPTLERLALRSMARQPNVALMGDRPYVLVPNYLSAFDVAWIPHRVGAGETGGDPIKLYEYWAAGKQVVTTLIDGMAANLEQVHTVRTSAEAANVIRGLLDGTVPPKPTHIPPDRTWAAIAARLLDAASR
jgi:glycosyltransferase involved in cell wall biosynthesis